MRLLEMLDAFFEDHVVLQRDIAAPVWGMGRIRATEVARVEFAGSEKNWQGG
jgi:hypothetical protein